MADLYRDHDQTKFYVSYRPNYPLELLNFIASKVPLRRLAWDVGTGSGQAAVPLSSLFESVVATDSSPEQISHAPTDITNLRFVVTPCSLSTDDLHRLVAPPGSVDLITVATTLHWLDIQDFFNQARRVLRQPGGVIAVWGYGMDLEIEGGRRAQEIYRRVLKKTNPFWEEEVRVMVEEGYAGVEEGKAPMRRFVAEREMVAEGVIAMVRTATGYQRARKAGVELLTAEVEEELKTAWGEEGEQVKKVKFPISLRIGKV